MVLNITPYSCQPILNNIWYVSIINIYASLELEYPNFIELVHIWINNNKKKRVQTLFVSDPLLLSYYLCMKNYIPRYINRKYTNKIIFCSCSKVPICIHYYYLDSNFFFTVGLTCAIILAPLVYLTISCSACHLADKFERESLKLQIAKFLCSSSVPFHSSMIGKKNPSHTWLESYCRRFGHWKNKKDANYFSSNILTNCIFVLEKKRTLVLHFLCQI